ncbi:hypothetical protein ABTY59_31815 [Streptomyces sp. NPDC096079]|uniref:hypothetical protein n=1 Tax=Streptomyces sp. NPDC096079 TaxID=3155820 RepID=UPI00331F511F
MTPEILARIATARAARDLSDLARLAVASTAQPASPTERIREARRLRELANQIVDLVTLAEALGGAGWEEITEALGRRDAATVEQEFGEDVAEWGATPEAALEAAAEGHEALDDWYARHREDQDPELPTPVADLLHRL